jgi:hypothetical protein
MESSKAVYKPVWHIPLLSVQWINSWWWTEELSETCRVSCQNKFVKLVHLVGFIIKNFFSLLLNCPHGLWGPLNLLFKWVMVFFAGETLPECKVSHQCQTLRMRGVTLTLPDVKRGNFALRCPSLAKSDIKLTWLLRWKHEYLSFLTLDVIKLFVCGLNTKLTKLNET